MSWLPEQAQGATDFARVFGLVPELQEAYDAFERLFHQRRLLEPRLLASCRALVEAIHRGGAPPEPRDDAERACLAFAEMFVRDPHAIGDADAAAVVAHLGEPGLVALAEALAIFDGFTRFRLLLAVGS